jgi:hypothetical protein
VGSILNARQIDPDGFDVIVFEVPNDLVPHGCAIEKG